MNRTQTCHNDPKGMDVKPFWLMTFLRKRFCYRSLLAAGFDNAGVLRILVVFFLVIQWGWRYVARRGMEDNEAFYPQSFLSHYLLTSCTWMANHHIEVNIFGLIWGRGARDQREAEGARASWSREQGRGEHYLSHPPRLAGAFYGNS